MNTILNFIKQNFAIFIIGILVLIFTSYLNTFFLQGSNIHRDFSAHDEYLTVREVYAILNPLSFKHFFMAIISGSMLYYGRIMYNIDAIFAWIPYLLFGVTGMVYTIRMVHVVLAISGIILLAKTFIDDKLKQVIFILGVFILYYSLYFAIVPKPEPHQLLFLALFFYYFKRKQYQFGWHFVFLGIAYGIKFSILVILPICFALPILISPFRFKQLFRSIIWFFIGLVFALPCLLLSPVKPIFLTTYINDTFGSAKHYDDVASVTFSDWIYPIWTSYYAGGIIFALLFLLGLVFIIGKSLKGNWKEFSHLNILIPVTIGLAINLPIFLATKRLWPHYLWVGHIFIWLGLCSVSIDSNRFKRIYLSILSLLIVGLLSAEFKYSKGLLSKENESKREMADALKAKNYLYTKNDSLIVLIDLSVYYTFQEFISVKRYHPFSSSYPAKEPLISIYWRTPISLGNIKETRANYLILNKEDILGNFNNNKKTEHDSLDFIERKKILKEMNKSIYYDTSFGTYRVYRIAKGMLDK